MKQYLPDNFPNVCVTFKFHSCAPKYFGPYGNTNIFLSQTVLKLMGGTSE